jgi:fido (protein-threonine AMPylation protein)
LAVAWDEDRPEDRALIEKNASAILRQIVGEAGLRRSPDVAMAQSWHRQIYEGATLPIWYFAGEIRDSDPRFPELFGYEVAVGATEGVPSDEVSDELDRFELSLRTAVSSLDSLIPVGSKPADVTLVESVVTLCALAHGEWIRIHPFANGNGRTGRLWADWCAVRYGLPPFVRLKPRPSGIAYSQAAARSMLGDHRLAVQAFLGLLEQYFSRLSD